MGAYTQICWFGGLLPLRFFPHVFKPKVITSKNKTNSKLLERTTVMAATSSSPSQHCRVSTRLWFSPIPSTPSNYGSHKLFPARSQNCCFTPNTCVQIRNGRQPSTSGELFLVGILQHEAQVTHTHTLCWPPFNRDAPLEHTLMAYSMVLHSALNKAKE